MPSLSTPHIRTVRGRLFLLITALGLPVLAILSALCWESYQSQRAAVRVELANTARAVASLVDAEINRSQAILSTLTSTRAAQELDLDTLDNTARRILGQGKRWMVVVDMEGQQLVNTLLPRNSALPRMHLDPTYVAAMQADRPFVSNLVFGPVAQDLVVHTGYPFRHPNGRLYGFSIVMFPGAIGETVNLTRFITDGVATIIDGEGRIISRSRGEKEFIGNSAVPTLVKAARASEEGVIESITLENIPVLTAFTRTQCGWTVAIGTLKSTMLASARRLLLIALSSSLAAAALAFCLAFSMARSVVASVDTLVDDARRMGRGEVPELHQSHLREIDSIAQAMRHMAQTLARELQAKTAAEAELREARDRLTEYAQELEKKVEERTASLREAITQMEEFSYTVSHDLRSPLRTIGGYAGVLMEDYGKTLNPDAQAYLEKIIRACERMDRLTTDVLKYSRVARSDVQCKPVNVEAVACSAVEHYNELNPHQADVHVVTPMHPVLAHEPSIAQALANLLTNAAKFVKPGERPHITIRTDHLGDRVRVWVEDRGIGIPKKHQEKLFRMFERAPTVGAYEGTGVGLAIVRKAAEKMGGTCGVESDGATGSRFWIELKSA